jgi:hypothetical protein
VSVPRCPTFALAIALIAGCGRIGYEPIALVEDRDTGPSEDTLRDMPSRDLTGGDLPDAAASDAAVSDAPPAEAGSLDQSSPDLADAGADGPAVPVDTRPDLPLDGPPPDTVPWPPASPTGPSGSATCFADPGRDILANFELGAPNLVAIDGRSASPFHLVTSGAGEIGVVNAASEGVCDSSGFMSFRGMAIPAGKNGHIQARLAANPPGGTGSFDARAFSGIRLSMRSSRPLSVSLKLPDTNTTTDVPYDHFSISLNVVTTWRTYVIPFSQLRQSGVGTRQPALNLAQLVAIELQIPDRDFDLYVDTIAFTR